MTVVAVKDTTIHNLCAEVVARVAGVMLLLLIVASFVKVVQHTQVWAGAFEKFNFFCSTMTPSLVLSRISLPRDRS